MANDRRDELIAAFISGTSTAEEDRALAQLAEASPSLRSEIAQHRVLDRLIREAARQPISGTRVVAALPRGSTSERVMRPVSSWRATGVRVPLRPRSWILPAVVTAAAAAATIVFFLWRPPAPSSALLKVPPPEAPLAPRESLTQPTLGMSDPSPEENRRFVPVLDEITGSVQVDTNDGPQRAQKALLMGGGVRLETGADGEARASVAPDVHLRVSDHTLVTWTAAGSALPSGDFELQLKRGSVAFDSFDRLTPGALRVATPEALVTAARARFTVTVNGATSRLDVLVGHIDVTRPGQAQAIRVNAKQFALITDDQDVVVRRRPPELLFLVGMSATVADGLAVAHLEGLGLLVKVRREATSADDLRDKDLVFISASVDSPFVPNTLREVRVPIVVCDPWVIDDLGMSAAGDGRNDFKPAQRFAVVNASAQALAGGLVGDVLVTTLPAPLGSAVPAPHATIVATLADHQPDRAMIFSYEEGVEMSGMNAPARRVAFLISEKSLETFAPGGWSLFDATIKWALGGVNSP